jgi:hypothetical protein
VADYGAAADLARAVTMRQVLSAFGCRVRSKRPAFPRQHGRQKPEFGLHFDGIGHSIGDFLAKEFEMPLAKPVNGHLVGNRP